MEVEELEVAISRGVSGQKYLAISYSRIMFYLGLLLHFFFLLEDVIGADFYFLFKKASNCTFCITSRVTVDCFSTPVKNTGFGSQAGWVSGFLWLNSWYCFEYWSLAVICSCLTNACLQLFSQAALLDFHEGFFGSHLDLRIHYQSPSRSP